jgi:drug/metabolite transporter (DMT)-like permease
LVLAITMTTVATVLITLAIAPLLTALFARVFLRHALPARTWVAIGVAGLGIAWMFGQQALAPGASMTGASSPAPRANTPPFASSCSTGRCCLYRCLLGMEYG